MITHKLIYTGDEYVFKATIELPFRLIDGDEIDAEIVNTSKTEFQKGDPKEFIHFLRKEGFFIVRGTKINYPGHIEVEIH